MRTGPVERATTRQGKLVVIVFYVLVFAGAFGRQIGSKRQIDGGIRHSDAPVDFYAFKPVRSTRYFFSSSLQVLIPSK